MRFVYDVAGNLAKQTDMSANGVSYSYDTPNRKFTESTSAHNPNDAWRLMSAGRDPSKRDLSGEEIDRLEAIGVGPGNTE